MLFTRKLPNATLGSAVLLLAGTVLLNGCAMNGGGTGSTATSVPLATHTFGGTIHGGQNPVSGATVVLWAAGTTGTYGTGATQVGTPTTTDSNGNFSFDTAGVSPCILGQHLYITATGGNPGLSSGGTNNYLALMAAIPAPCSASTGATNVFIDEVTTVATVTALQQFMSINTSAAVPYAGTGAVPWTIGAPATNLTGLANAFTQVGNIVNISTGQTGTSFANGTAGTVGFVNQIIPSTSKINLLADILANCINSNGTVCSSFFADTTPSSKNTPVDTIQSMYYIATNPAGLTMPAHGSAGSPYWLCSTYATATAPFQPTANCSTTQYPVDWAITVTWGTSGNATGTVQVPNIAIDGSGNIWTAENINGTASVVELNQAATVIQKPVTATTAISLTSGLNASSYTGSQTVTLGGGKYSNALAIDTNNNAWYLPYYTTLITVGSTSETPVVEISPATASTQSVTGYLTYPNQTGIAIDGSNNIYFSIYTPQYYYLSSLTGSPLTYTEGSIRASHYYLYTAVNQATPTAVNANSATSYAWIMNESCSTTIARTDAAVQTSAGSGSTITTATCGLWGATDAIGNLWGTDGYLEYVDIRNSVTAPTITQYASGTANTGGVGGLYGAAGVAIDGAGNVWVVNAAGGSLGGVSEFTPGANGTTLTALSPTGPSIYGFFNAGYGGTPYVEGPGAIAIDSSGNVWIGTASGSYLNYIVGAAAPVTTPYAAQIANTAVGTRP